MPAWRAALDACGTAADLWEDTIEIVVWRWLDAALGHPRMRERISCVFVLAATPTVPVGGPDGIEAGSPGMTTAKLMTGMVRRWAAQDHTNRVRREIKEDIVIRLTQPGWLRLLKVLYVKLRNLAGTATNREHRGGASSED